MSLPASCYPPNPERVPADLTEMTWPYFLRMLLVLVCLILFVAVYLGLLAGSAYTCYACFVAMRDDHPTFRGYEERQRRGERAKDSRPRQLLNPGVAVVGMASSGLLCLFLLKGFFKSRRRGPNLEVEITEKDQPELFTFIRRLCQDAGAPMPYRVFIAAEVNAAVVYDNSLLNLLAPTSKNLVIGLGLVNRLNLSEFKAVLAHEFGHFAQGSMLFGSYVYRANHIIADMVYGRDFFDDLVDRMQYSRDRVLPAFALCVRGVIWGLRKGLEGLFHAINFANSSLSRQMEFNADLTAVKLSGSDAIIHALAKLEFAAESLAEAMRQLTHAADHKIYTRDLFFHQTRAAEYFKQRRAGENWGEVPPLPEDPARTNQIFEPGDLDVPLMWATHPSNFDREANAKRRYLRAAIDERSPWLLFQDEGKLRERLTKLYYVRVQKIPAERLADPQTVQAFIDADTAETTYAPRFHGMYDERPLELTGWDMWVHIGMEMRDPVALRGFHEQLYGPWLKALLDKHGRLVEERIALEDAAQTGKAFSFRDRTQAAADAPGLLEKVEEELARIERRLGAHDRIVFQVHYAMAQPRPADTDELLARYRFQAGAQTIAKKLNDAQTALNQVLEGLSGRRQLSAEQFQALIKFFQDVHVALTGVLDDAARLHIPRLQNMAEGQSLREFLLPEPLVAYLSRHAQTLEAPWLNRLAKQVAEMVDRSRRVQAKGVGGILALHDRIAATWLAGEQGPADAACTPAIHQLT